MSGRGFLDVARELAAGATEFHWRTAAVNAYYALFLECRDMLLRWGSVMPRRDNAHAWVRLRLTFAADVGLNKMADALDDLVKLRNRASYRLAPSAVFASSSAALDAIQWSADALAVLDQIDGDPVLRAAAIASLPP